MQAGIVGGVVVDTIRPNGKGKIRLCGVYWAARTDSLTHWPVLPNTVVSIKDRVGLVLIVEPLPIENSTYLSTVVPLSRKLRTPSDGNADIAA